MPRLEQHRQHLAPQVHRGQLLVELQLAARDLVLVAQVGLLEGAADLVVQFRRVGGRKQRPLRVFHHALHEQVRDPVRRVHVVRAPAVVAGVLAQLEEFLDVQVPGLEVGAHRALPLAALVHRHRGVVDHLQERHHALRLAVGALDVGAERAHRGPVVAQAARVLGEQRVFLDRVVDAGQVVGHRGQVARRQLRAQRARVEQRRRRAHEIEGREHVVELDRARLAVLFVQRQAHRHAHEEGLRQFDALAALVQEVAVVQGLQAEIAELQVAVRVQRLAQPGQVERGQRGIEQLGGDAARDELGEVSRVARRHLRVQDFLAEDFEPDRVQQQPRRGVAVGRVLLDQRARGEDDGLAHLVHRHAVVQVAQGALADRRGRGAGLQALAGRGEQRIERLQVERLPLPVLDHVQLRPGAARFLRGLFLRALLGPESRALLAVQHVGAGDVVLARAHQREFHLVLDVFDMEGAALGLPAHQRVHHAGGQVRHQLADARRGGALAAAHREVGLGHRHRDLGRLEADHRAVAADDLVVRVRRALRSTARLGNAPRDGVGGGRALLRDVHLPSPLFRSRPVVNCAGNDSPVTS